MTVYWNGREVLTGSFGRHTSAVWHMCLRRSWNGTRVSPEELRELVSAALLWRLGYRGDLDKRSTAYVRKCVGRAIDDMRRSRGLDIYSRTGTSVREWRRMEIMTADPQGNPFTPGDGDDADDYTILDQDRGDPTFDAVAGTDDGWADEWLESGLVHFPEAKRQAFEMIHVNQYPVAHAAEDLGVTRPTVQRWADEVQAWIRDQAVSHMVNPEKAA